MFNSNEGTNRRHLFMMVALFFCLCSIYMLTYNGKLMFNDELQMFNVTRSLVDFGDDKYDLAMWYVWTNYGPLGQDQTQLYPLPQSPAEPFHMLLGTPFYIFGKLFPGLGAVHIAWLLNVFIGAGICVVFFQYARLLGYDERVAIVAALALGLCTAIWPYTRTYLRELTVMLMLLLTAYLLERWRLRKGAWHLLAALLTFLLAFFTKEAAAMFLPAFVLIAFPNVTREMNQSRLRGVLNAGLVVVALLVLLLIYTDIIERLLPEHVRLVGRLYLNVTYFRVALHSYLLSVGGSIWGTSPILLLALPGAWLLLYQNRQRYVWVMILAVVVMAVGHAITTRVHWAGGATWPPRFIIPVIPFVMICTLPVFDRILRRQASILLVMAVGFIVTYSLWWQVVGVSISWYDYAANLPPESGGLNEWGPGLNTLRYMRPAVLTPLWFQQPLDFAWERDGNYLWPLVFGVLTAGWGLLLGWLWQGRALSLRKGLVAAGVGGVIFGLSVFWALASFYEDDLYQGGNESLHQVAAFLAGEEQSGDILLLNTPDYHEFFLNYGDFDHLRIVTLPLAPGERSSFEEPAPVFDDPGELLDTSAIALIHALAFQRDRLWLLMDTGPFLHWSVRPVERFLAGRFYRMREVEFVPPNPQVRLLEFSTAHIQEDRYVYEEANLLFGESLHLTHYYLPLGMVYSPGEILPLSLFWVTDEPVTGNYSVALFLADAGSVVAQGQDSMPGGTFAPTGSWEVGETIQDNRALRLPADLPLGEYHLWVRLYTLDDGRLETLPVTGADVIEGDIGLLPVNIIVE